MREESSLMQLWLILTRTRLSTRYTDSGTAGNTHTLITSKEEKTDSPTAPDKSLTSREIIAGEIDIWRERERERERFGIVPTDQLTNL